MELTYDKINLLAYIQKSWLVILRLKNMIERRKTNRPISNRIFVSCLRLFNRQWWSVFISKLRQRTQRSKPKKDLDRYNKKQKLHSVFSTSKLATLSLLVFVICSMASDQNDVFWGEVFKRVKTEWFLRR